MHDLTKDRVRLIRAITNGVFNAQYKQGGYMHRVSDKFVEQFAVVVATIRQDMDGHYLSFSQDSPELVSYATKPEYRFDNDRRTKTTLGKYLRRRLKVGPDMIPDIVLASVVSYLFGSLSDASKDIEIVTGDDITDAYASHYGECSCMTGCNGDLVELYALNPDKVAMVKYRNGIDARALLWTTDDDKKVLDRIYPCSGAHVDALEHWAAREGYAFRNPNMNACVSDGRTHRITLKHNDGCFPYMDTFRYGKVDFDKNTVVFSNVNERGDLPHRFDYTDGSFAGDPYPNRRRDYDYYCCNCHDGICEDDAYYAGGDYYCEGCYNDEWTHCEVCGDPVHRDEVTDFTNRFGNQWYAHLGCLEYGDFFYCQECDEWHANERRGAYDEETGEELCCDCHEAKAEEAAAEA